MIPFTTSGSEQTQASQLNLVHIAERLLIEPINATGNVHRMIRATVMESEMAMRIQHHYKYQWITSEEWTSMYRLPIEKISNQCSQETKMKHSLIRYGSW
jgi:hypothetical protein